MRSPTGIAPLGWLVGSVVRYQQTGSTRTMDECFNIYLYIVYINNIIIMCVDGTVVGCNNKLDSDRGEGALEIALASAVDNKGSFVQMCKPTDEPREL